MRLEGDDSEYLCLNDSISETFVKNLESKKVDSTITILYDYDNGRLPGSIRAMIWSDKGIGKVRIIQGCDRITKDTTFEYNLAELWRYIDQTKFDDVSIRIKSGNGQSHDMFYHITVATPTKSFIVVVRDNERQRTEKHKTPETDSRVMLTNKVDAILK
ncbi:hypothetical protein [Terrimonas alba]|uniref:hypothetical protein n=1 Tax=Terrimonas alba TaxID=3349636 RepID=UPI0035F3E24B